MGVGVGVVYAYGTLNRCDLILNLHLSSVSWAGRGEELQEQEPPGVAGGRRRPPLSGRPQKGTDDAVYIYVSIPGLGTTEVCGTTAPFPVLRSTPRRYCLIVVYLLSVVHIYIEHVSTWRRYTSTWTDRTSFRQVDPKEVTAWFVV